MAARLVSTPATFGQTGHAPSTSNVPVARPDLERSFVRESSRRPLRPSRRADETNEPARRRALDEAGRAGRLEEALAHGEWLVGRYAAAGVPAAVCETFHALQALGPVLRLSAHTLWLAVLAANSCGDAALVADATRRLLRDHASSRQLPMALLVTARHQLAEGRPELARATLAYLMEAHPQSPAAHHARSMFAHFTALSTFGTHE